MQIKKPRYTGENPLPGRSTTAVVECREERGAGGEFSVQGWKLNFSASTSISPLPVPSAAYLHLARPPPALCVHTTALECIVRGTRRPTKYETRRTGKERERRGKREKKTEKGGRDREKKPRRFRYTNPVASFLPLPFFILLQRVKKLLKLRRTINSFDE